MTKTEEAIENGQRPFFRRYLYALLVGIALIIITTALFPLSSLVAPLATPKAGDLAALDVVAPFTIPIRRTPSEIETEKDATLQSIPELLLSSFQ